MLSHNQILFQIKYLVDGFAFKKMKNKSRGIGISNASFCYLTKEAQLLSSSSFRFWFQMIFQLTFASFVPGLIVTLEPHVGHTNFPDFYTFTVDNNYSIDGLTVCVGWFGKLGLNQYEV